MLKIILINPSHPGNIGATARAMKTMGFDNLHLVQPQQYPHPQANALASGADDVLQNSQVHQSIDEALADCHFVVGTSARTRALAIPLFTPRDFANWHRQQTPDKKIALLFGRENSGLTNEELNRCHYHVMIPANPEYSSLNLAQAVQILCYELHSAITQPQSQLQVNAAELAEQHEMQQFFQHLEATLKRINFIKPNVPNRIMPRLKRLFNRASCDKTELNILRGILTEINKNNEL
ncbi:MAG: RNA methyltransferase [Pseudomonadota bacterium]